MSVKRSRSAQHLKSARESELIADALNVCTLPRFMRSLRGYCVGDRIYYFNTILCYCGLIFALIK